MKIPTNPLLILAVFAFFTTRCKDAEVEPGEYAFTVMKEVIPSELGAVFRAEVLDAGSKKAQSFGFVWGTSEPNIEQSDTVLIVAPLMERVYEKQVEFTLLKGVTYSVRPFVTYGSKTVYGSKINFKISGNENNTWYLVSPENSEFSRTYSSFATSTKEKGYVLFQDGKFFSYDPNANSFTRLIGYPVQGNFATAFTAGSKDDALYVTSDIDQLLYKYEDRNWTSSSSLPFTYDRAEYYHVLSVRNSLIFLSSSVAFEYNTVNGIWTEKAPMPSTAGTTIQGTSLDRKAYLLGKSKEIIEYSSETDSWEIIATYPGSTDGTLVAFAFENKIYFGIGSVEGAFWSFDLTQKEWRNEAPIPSSLRFSDQHHFSLDNKLYVGRIIQFLEYWVFDPSEK